MSGWQILEKLKNNPATRHIPVHITSVEEEVLDELQLFIHPVVANKGKRLFKEGGALQRFNLVECQPTSSGTIIARYQLRKSSK